MSVSINDRDSQGSGHLTTKPVGHSVRREARQRWDCCPPWHSIAYFSGISNAGSSTARRIILIVARMRILHSVGSRAVPKNFTHPLRSHTPRTPPPPPPPPCPGPPSPPPFCRDRPPAKSQAGDLLLELMNLVLQILHLSQRLLPLAHRLPRKYKIKLNQIKTSWQQISSSDVCAE